MTIFKMIRHNAFYSSILLSVQNLLLLVKQMFYLRSPLLLYFRIIVCCDVSIQRKKVKQARMLMYFLWPFGFPWSPSFLVSVLRIAGRQNVFPHINWFLLSISVVMNANYFRVACSCINLT